MRQVQSYSRGVILILLGSTCSSWIGIGVRIMESANAWQILAYRSIAVVVVLLLYISIRNHGRLYASFRNIGLAGIIGALGLAAASSGIIVAIDNASVANSMFLLAVAPFMAAVLGWIVLRERVRGATWFAIICAFTGVTIMVAEGIRFGYFWGNVAGLIAALGFAIYIIALRWGRLTDMLPLNIFGALVAMGIAISISIKSGAGLSIPAHDVIWSLAMGAFQLGLALILITLGSRSVPAADISLLAMTEVVLAPIWVWLVYGETVGTLTLTGGALLLGAIAGDAVTGIREKKRQS